MKRSRKLAKGLATLVVTLSLVFASLAIPTATAHEEESSSEHPFNAVLELIDLILGGFDEDAADQPEEQQLVAYVVDGDKLKEGEKPAVSADLEALQNDRKAHEALWSRFTTLIPAEYRKMVNRFEVFTDGPDGALAMVMPDETDPAKWLLAVDIGDTDDRDDLDHSLIHEFGHLLTLNASQVPPGEFAEDAAYDREAARCATFFTGEGCSRDGSYINTFVEKFWGDIRAELEKINALESDEEYERRMDVFYGKYEDRFVSDYAAVDPGEDIAESWTAFVLKDRPTGDSVADAKVRCFYDHPELVELRDAIRSNSA